MSQTKTSIKFRQSRRPAGNYIQITKGGTRYVRAIDVLRSDRGRKAIGALLEETTDSDAPSSNGAASGQSVSIHTGQRSEATTSNEAASSSGAIIEPAAMRASSGTG